MLFHVNSELYSILMCKLQDIISSKKVFNLLLNSSFEISAHPQISAHSRISAHPRTPKINKRPGAYSKHYGTRFTISDEIAVIRSFSIEVNVPRYGILFLAFFGGDSKFYSVSGIFDTSRRWPNIISWKINGRLVTYDKIQRYYGNCKARTPLKSRFYSKTS